MTPGRWRKSTHSGGNTGNCVETRTFNAPEAFIEVRDSKASESGSLVVSRHEFIALLDSLNLSQS